MDPRECAKFIKKMFPWIDDAYGCVTSHVWLPSGPFLLVIVREFMPQITLASFLHFLHKFTCTHFQTSFCPNIYCL